MKTASNTQDNVYQDQYNDHVEHTSSEPSWLYIPGLPHFVIGKQVSRGLIYFAGFAFALISLIGILLLPLIIQNFTLFCGSACQSFLNVYFKISDPTFFTKIAEIDPLAQLTVAATLVILMLYLSQVSYKDYHQDFNHIELDQRPNVFAPSFSFAYIQSTVLVIFLFIYGIFYFTPPLKEIPLEITFVDNPPTKEQLLDDKTKRIARQNARNTGKSVKKKELAPGKVRKNKPITQQRNKYQSNKKAASRKTSPYVSKNKQSKANKPSPAQKPKPKIDKKQKQAVKKEKTTTKSEIGKKLPDYQPKKKQSISKPQKQSQQRKASQSSNAPQGIKAPIISRSNSRQQNPFGSGNSAPNNNAGPGTLSARRSVDYGPYMRQLQRLINNAWQPVKNGSRDSVILLFNIRNTGQLVLNSIRVKHSSSPQAEKAAKQAILNAAPYFRPLPQGAAKEVTVEFKFSKLGIKSL